MIDGVPARVIARFAAQLGVSSCSASAGEIIGGCHSACGVPIITRTRFAAT
jgi:hypothetical protein